MAELRLTMLGGFDLAADDKTVVLRTRKARALLAVLALEPGRAWPCEKLAAMLWQFSGEDQARTSLRQTLSLTRKAVPTNDTDWLRADRDSLIIDERLLTADTAMFGRLLAEGDVDSLTGAIALYNGDLLDGRALREDTFEEWLRTERTRLSEAATDALARLVAHHGESRAFAAGIAAAARLLAIDPLREEIHRALMELYALAGQTDAALRQFQTCSDILDTELAVAPARETEVLYEKILERRFGAVGADAPADAAAAAPDPVAPPLPLPDKPSIAALPFDNMSGDDEQTYFSDGITDDIITELSRNRSLFVISRKSSFAYLDNDKSVRSIAEELGVRYVLEGSVRRAGDRVRITAQLIDAPNGNHLWVGRYDRDLEDVFAVQDEVARTIVATLVGRLDAAAEVAARDKPTRDMEAYDFALRGMHHLHHYHYAHDGFARARDMLEQAIRRDPGYARAYGLLALVHVYDWFWDLTGPGRELAVEAGHKAVELDEQDARPHIAICVAQMFSDRLDLAENHISQALVLNPNDDLALIEQGRLLMCLGQPEQGADRVREAMRLNPFHPNWYWNILGRNLHTSGRFDEALDAFNRIDTPPYSVHAYFAACYACLGRMAEAQVHREEVLTRRPDFSVAFFTTGLPYRDPALRESFLDTFRKAGFPEGS